MKRQRNNAFVSQACIRFSQRRLSLGNTKRGLSSPRPHVVVSALSTNSSAGPTRRAVISSAAVVIAGQFLSICNAEEYDAMRTKRYLDTGRPVPADASIPGFDSKKTVFDVSDSLKGQDVKAGTGPEVKKGSLVRAQWVISLADGSVVEDTTTSGSVVFRVGAGQVPSGIENSVLGMKSGGSRIIIGSSTSFFSDITSGGRTLVPKNSDVHMDILVQQLEPYARK